jgi:hypothetical protein
MNSWRYRCLREELTDQIKRLPNWGMIFRFSGKFRDLWLISALFKKFMISICEKPNELAISLSFENVAKCRSFPASELTTTAKQQAAETLLVVHDAESWCCDSRLTACVSRFLLDWEDFRSICSQSCPLNFESRDHRLIVELMILKMTVSKNLRELPSIVRNHKQL